MKSSQQGVILITTMAIIFLMTVLVLSHLQQNFLYAKALGAQQAHDKKFYAMEEIAFEIVHRVNNACLQKSNHPQKVLRSLKKTGCVVEKNKTSYRYIFEEVGVFPCLKIKTTKGLIASQHYRFSITLDTAEELGYLQLYKIQALEKDLKCDDRAFIIIDGLRSWHYGFIKD